MQLVEQHVIARGDPRYAMIDKAAFASKNLYNAANYLVRQTYIFQKRYLPYKEVYAQMKPQEVYKSLPAKVAQQVLIQLDHDWRAFFAARKAYWENSANFSGCPKLPAYKHKTEGRNVLIYTYQAISKPAFKHGIINLPMLPIEIQTRQRWIDQVRIVPRNGYYTVEVIYQKEVQQADVNPDLCAAIDLGVNNLATVVSNKPEFVPRIVNGRSLKAVNQWYNKRIAELQKKLGTTSKTKQMQRITNKRNRRIKHELHIASKQIINLLVQEGIGTLIIGKNVGWKHEVNQGKHNNQNFVYIPHDRFIDMLTYKAQVVGIRVELTEESYTSKASFLDGDEIPTYGEEGAEKHKFSGRRVKRGLYCTKSKQYINADVNGAYNILRKRRPDAFAKGVAGYVVHPVRMTRTNPTKREVA